jgi:hypothetical protein
MNAIISEAICLNGIWQPKEMGALYQFGVGTKTRQNLEIIKELEDCLPLELGGIVITAERVIVYPEKDCHMHFGTRKLIELGDERVDASSGLYVTKNEELGIFIVRG